MVRLSQHFVRNWNHRVGRDPDPAEVQRIIDRGVKVQSGGMQIRAPGFMQDRTLSIFWDPEAGIIVKVDESRMVAVTVLSSTMHRRRSPARGCDRR